MANRISAGSRSGITPDLDARLWRLERALALLLNAATIAAGKVAVDGMDAADTAAGGATPTRDQIAARLAAAIGTAP
jgi:hypothetical protein